MLQRHSGAAFVVQLLRSNVHQSVDVSVAVAASRFGSEFLCLAQRHDRRHRDDPKGASHVSGERRRLVTAQLAQGKRRARRLEHDSGSSGSNCKRNDLRLVIVVLRRGGWPWVLSQHCLICVSQFSSEQSSSPLLRNPYDWALAMHKSCRCRRTREDNQRVSALDFSTFLTMPWTNDAFSTKPRAGRSPACANVMECRGLKIQSHLDVRKWAPNVEVRGGWMKKPPSSPPTSIPCAVPVRSCDWKTFSLSTSRWLGSSGWLQSTGESISFCLPFFIRSDPLRFLPR